MLKEERMSKNAADRKQHPQSVPRCRTVSDGPSVAESLRKSGEKAEKKKKSPRNTLPTRKAAKADGYDVW